MQEPQWGNWAWEKILSENFQTAAKNTSLISQSPQSPTSDLTLHTFEDENNTETFLCVLIIYRCFLLSSNIIDRRGNLRKFCLEAIKLLRYLIVRLVILLGT